jgi:hypothetical protein
MKILPAILFLVTVFSAGAQTVATTANVLHPIMKDTSKRNAPTSLDRDPAEKAALLSTGPALRSSPSTSVQPFAPAKPVEIVARIDAGLAASQISLIGTVNGIKGRMYVTNIGSQTVIPLAQFAVCDQKGFQVGSATKTGQPLAPNDVERIEVVGTNLNAVDLKLMKLSAGAEKK